MLRLILQSAVIVLIGASTYFAVCICLWLFAGRPQSVEQKVVLIARAWLETRFARGSGTSPARPI